MLKRMWWTPLRHGLSQHLILVSTPDSLHDIAQTTFPPPTTFLILRSSGLAFHCLSRKWTYTFLDLCLFSSLQAPIIMSFLTGQPYSSLYPNPSCFSLGNWNTSSFPKEINTHLFSATLSYTYGPVFHSHSFLHSTYLYRFGSTNNPSKKLGWMDKDRPTALDRGPAYYFLVICLYIRLLPLSLLLPCLEKSSILKDPLVLA